MVDPRQGEVVLRAMLVYWFVVHAHAEHVRVFLVYQHWVCYPGGLFSFPDELGVEQPVNFFSDCSALGL